MKELDYPPNFGGRVYWDFLDFPKKNLGSGGLTPYGAWDPPNALFWGPGPHKGWGPQTPKFFWEVQEVPIDSAPKIR